jgi:hypothetical protein
MTRTLTVREYLLETLNRRVRERGEDVELVFDRPKPRLVADRGVTAMAVSSMNGEHFAALLEKAIARSQAPLKQIEHRPNDGPVLEPRPRGIHGRSGERQGR